jgi:hypothetical protein
MSVTPLEQLARWRTLGTRNSEQVLNLGVPLLNSNLGDQGMFSLQLLVLMRLTEWAVREQIVVAALDLGRIKLAEVCISRASTQKLMMLSVETTSCLDFTISRITSRWYSIRSQA